MFCYGHVNPGHEKNKLCMQQHVCGLPRPLESLVENVLNTKHVFCVPVG